MELLTTERQVIGEAKTRKVAALFDAALIKLESASMREWAQHQRDIWIRILESSWDHKARKGLKLTVEDVVLRITIEAIGL